MVELTIVIPVHNEAANIRPLLEEIHASLQGRIDFEVVYVDDGSDDATAGTLRREASRFPRLTIVTHPVRSGQSAALHTGVARAGAEWIMTLDGDGQNDPADILRFWSLLKETDAAEETFLIGRRVERKGFIRRVSSRVANTVRSALLSDGTPDVGCGLKLFRRELYLSLPFFDHMHRFLPALAQARGARVRSVPVRDRERRSGRSHYGIGNRLWVGIVDLLGVMWLVRRMKGAAPRRRLARATSARPRRNADATTKSPAADAGGSRRSAALLVSLWGLLTVAGLVARPLLPVDETRYLSVAWEMWLRHAWLVPQLNGAPYSDKPPLFFWSILAGWKLFGVDLLWARLVGPLFGLFCLFLLPPVARRLWPGDDRLAAAAPWVLVGSLPWVVYGTLVMFDTLLTFMVLLAVLGGLKAARREGRSGWLLLAAATGGGILAKGPVALLHLLPAVLLLPFFGPVRLERRGRWFRNVALAVAAGIGLALLWAVPAALAGGSSFGRSIFLSQTTGRIVTAFAHQRPVWWYLPILPLVVAPWLLVPGFRRIFSAGWPGDPGSRFCLAWAAPVFVAFSLISGKQVHYLLPIVPPLALLATRALVRAPDAPGVPAASAPFSRIPRVATLTVVAAALIQIAAFPWIDHHYSLKPIAGYLHSMEKQGRPIAHVGKYSGQYHFLGRLQKPFDVIPAADVPHWLREHPNGAVVSYSRTESPALGAFVQHYEREFVVVRDAGHPPIL